MFAKLYTRLNNKHLDLISRGIFAVAGGLFLTALITMLLSVSLPFQRAEAVMTANLLSFLVYSCIAMWAFCCRSIWRHWLYFFVICAALAGLLLVI